MRSCLMLRKVEEYGRFPFFYVDGVNHIQAAYSYNRESGTTGCISQSVK